MPKKKKIKLALVTLNITIENFQFYSLLQKKSELPLLCSSGPFLIHRSYHGENKMLEFIKRENLYPKKKRSIKLLSFGSEHEE